MDDETIHSYFLYSFALVSVFCVAQFSGTNWLLPLFLTVWALLGLFRLFVLTTPFQGKKNASLPVKILASLGLKKQERREDILMRVFMNPFLLMFISFGVSFLFIEYLTYKPLLQDHLVASFWGHVASVNVRSGSVFLALECIFFPFLCGLIFMLFCSHAIHTGKNMYAAFGFSGVFLAFAVLHVFSGSTDDALMSSYMTRVSVGGFWLASMPYFLGLLIAAIPAVLFFDGLRGVSISSVFLSLILLSMGIVDMNFAANGMTQALLLTGWIICGLVTGPVIYKVQGDYHAYRGFKENLDFGTKIEHS